ncbi:hypothetical protein [Paenibacillus silviterrae]|uniref:hypothetical protein n=1 Tax=Paenibacillus silviterrae TaxID=3242194 RepID=UPI002543D1C8|nr:hypothetical protein [Paenibacillus chinjuensis]
MGVFAAKRNIEVMTKFNTNYELISRILEDQKRDIRIINELLRDDSNMTTEDLIKIHMLSMSINKFLNPIATLIAVIIEDKETMMAMIESEAINPNVGYQSLSTMTNKITTIKNSMARVLENLNFINERLLMKKQVDIIH